MGYQEGQGSLGLGKDLKVWIWTDYPQLACDTRRVTPTSLG